jgi:hypothetical protein
VVIHIQGRAGNDVCPLLFDFSIEVVWAISYVGIIMARPGFTVIVAEFDGVHLMILQEASEG